MDKYLILVPFVNFVSFVVNKPRAGDGIRTREYQLGRLMPYHLATPALLREVNST